MYEAGLFLLIFSGLSLLQATVSHFVRLVKWNSFRTTHGGKRQAAIRDKTDWVQWIGRQILPVLSAARQRSLRSRLIWSGIDVQGRVEQFLGLCGMLFAGGVGLLLVAGVASAASNTLLPVVIGLPISVLTVAAPVLAIITARLKRADSIVREIPGLVLTVRRELSRDANYIDAFSRAESDVQGVLRGELAELNRYVRSTQGDVRTALAHFKERCGHRAVDLFCMTIVQGMDTDRVVEGLTELDQQMSNILQDRLHKQTEKRNLMVFFGTIVAASILMLQGAFYGLMKLREQMSSIPF